MTEPGSNTRRLAVLIDADNTSHRHAGDLLEEVARYGIPTVKRAYGDWTTPRLGGWKDELNRNAITPVQQFAYTTGKNSTDSALIIDAMDLLYTGDLDAFAIVSSDSDFTRLVTRLRESGRTVYGLGRRRTPQSLVAACDKFIYLEVLGQDGDDGTAPKSSDPGEAGDDGEDVPDLPELQPLVSSAIAATSDDDGWSHLGAVGSYLNTRNASFDPRNYGFSKLIALARAQTWLEVDRDSGSAPKVRVRDGDKAPQQTRKKSAKKADASTRSRPRSRPLSRPRSPPPRRPSPPVTSRPRRPPGRVPRRRHRRAARRRPPTSPCPSRPPADPEPTPEPTSSAGTATTAPKVVTRTRTRRATS